MAFAQSVRDGSTPSCRATAAVRPEVKVLHMSGYTDEAIGNQGALEPGIHFLQKRSRTSTGNQVRRPRRRAWIRRPRVEGAKYTHLISSVAEQLFRFDAPGGTFSLFSNKEEG